MTTSSTMAVPVSQSERITLLDSLRGIAILGILLMNIPIFALAPPIGFDPTLLNEPGTINYYVWYAVVLVFNGTQRALFSMLFGAGIILFITRQENKLSGLAAADYFFRRQVWLMAISAFDVFILQWNGDILFDYASLGMILFIFRSLPPKTLILAAAICLGLMLARENRDFYEDKAMISRGETIEAMDTLTVKLTKKEKHELEAMTAFRKRATHASKLERSAEINETVRGSYGDVYKWRTGDYLGTIVDYLYLSPWDVLIFMFLGMAFYKLGVLTGNAPVRLYVWMMVIGLILGIALSFVRVRSFVDDQFNYFNHVKNTQISYHQLERVFRSLGIFGFIMVLYKSGGFRWFFEILRPAGQMALTNYLGQSLICGLLFNGYGFGMFGRLQRYEIYLVVLAIWVFQIIFSAIWLRYYYYGPCEWIWRSLTYWKPQPFLKKAGTVAIS